MLSRAGSKRESRKTRGFLEGQGRRAEGRATTGEEVRGGMAMEGLEEAERQSEHPTDPYSMRAGPAPGASGRRQRAHGPWEGRSGHRGALASARLGRF